MADRTTSPLFTDQYELTMMQAYWREGMTDDAVFTLFCRRLPEGRNYLLACGLDDALRYLEEVRFDAEALEYLSTDHAFGHAFLAWLADFRFTGDVHAVPEGTPVFANEPLIEVVAPIAQAQLAETYLMNQIHFQTVAASKAARVARAARGRTTVDFGLRRMHGADAGLKGARAFYIAGIDATSNVLAGQVYGVPVAGTMAHSYIQAHDSEEDAFRAFLALYPDTILLVDTYDTLEGVETVIRLAGELGGGFRARGIRLDSGDLGALARAARERLDEAGLESVEIFASGGLDEHEIARLLDEGAPITGFGVGTDLGVSSDAPALDIAYKLVAYAGRGRLKLSTDKGVLPGRKQVFRIEENGRAMGDIIARAGEDLPGRPLIRQVMRGGARIAHDTTDLDAARERARREIDALPDRVRGLAPADPPYPVEISEALRRYQKDVARRVAGPARAPAADDG